MIEKRKSFGCDMAKNYWKKRFKKLTGVQVLKRDLTPLRYPGGKGSLKYFLANILVDNDLYGKTLVEPFCGGAGASIPLLAAGMIDHLYLNDKSPAIFNFWKNVFFNTDEFLSLIQKCDISLKEWGHQKNIASKPNGYSSVEVGFSTFFLNRCNRSGLLSAGPIGGMDQSGRYKIDCRFNKENLIDRIEQIASFRDKVSVSGHDASKFLETLNNETLSNSLIFIDPPYVVQGENLYKDCSFDERDHERFAQYIKQKAWKWVITYDDHPLIHALYAERAVGVIELSYLMQSAKVGRELLVASTHCRIPFPKEDSFNPRESGKAKPELLNVEGIR
ncbi:MAG: DNA methyltransferase [Halomonas sp.]|nr:DNA methyltransferase [Halomonas sp.]